MRESNVLGIKKRNPRANGDDMLFLIVTLAKARVFFILRQFSC